MDEYYFTLAEVLRERLDLIADHQLRGQNPTAHLERLCPAFASLAAEAGTSWGICLNGLSELTRLPPELGRLTSLQLLDLSWCVQLSDLSPLGRTQLPPAAQPLPVQSTQRPFKLVDPIEKLRKEATKNGSNGCATSRSITGPIQTCAYTCSVKKRSHPLRCSTRMAQTAPTRESSGGCDRRAWKIHEEQIKGLAGEELCVG